MTANLLSQIRIIDSDRILPFEWALPSASPEPASSDEARYVRHPLPVLDLQNGNYLLLESAERLDSPELNTVKHLPVQLCPRKGIKTSSEMLGLIDFDAETLYRLAARHSDQILLEPPHESGTKYQTAAIQFRDGEPAQIYFRDSSRSGCPASVDLFFRHLLQHSNYQTVIESAAQAESVFRTASFSAYLSFPTFPLEQLVAAASSDRLFPPGVVSVQMDSRIFYVDFPLSVLQSDLPTKEKESFLKDLIRMREQSRRTTHYRGQIYILNR